LCYGEIKNKKLFFEKDVMRETLSTDYQPHIAHTEFVIATIMSGAK